MELEIFSVARIQAFFICLARVGSLMGTMPIFSGRQVPARIRVGLAVSMALVIFPAAEPYLPQADFRPLALGLLVAQEAIFGLMLAFIAQFVFNAVELGGTVISYKMGFAAANIFDPQTQNQVSVIPQFQNVLAMLIFLSLDLHHMFLRAMVDSYRVLKPGELDFSGPAFAYLIELSSSIFVLGVKLSAPVLAVLILSSLVLGLMARVFPQLNVFMLSFPVNIGVSFLVIGLTLNMVAAILVREFNRIGERFIEIFQLL